MSKASEQIPVISFITESDRNLALAELIHQHYPAAREDVVKGFFKRLAEAILKSGMRGEYNESLFETRWGAFNFFKPAWHGLYSIRIEAYDHGRRMIYGVHRHGPMQSQPHDKQLTAAVQKKFPHAAQRKSWAADILMRAPAADWRTADVLWRMHKDQSFLAELEAMLLEMADLTGSHIDRLVRAAKR